MLREQGVARDFASSQSEAVCIVVIDGDMLEPEGILSSGSCTFMSALASVWNGDLTDATDCHLMSES